MTLLSNLSNRHTRHNLFISKKKAGCAGRRSRPADTGLPPIDPRQDRAMICGSPAMLDDTSALLDELGLNISPRMGEPGDYVIERAFVEK